MILTTQGLINEIQDFKNIKGKKRSQNIKGETR
jgi:hypothetical protein